MGNKVSLMGFLFNKLQLADFSLYIISTARWFDIAIQHIARLKVIYPCRWWFAKVLMVYQRVCITVRWCRVSAEKAHVHRSSYPDRRQLQWAQWLSRGCFSLKHWTLHNGGWPTIDWFEKPWHNLISYFQFFWAETTSRTVARIIDAAADLMQHISKQQTFHGSAEDVPGVSTDPCNNHSKLLPLLTIF